MKLPIRLMAVAMLMSSMALVNADALSGKAVAVLDGDTIRLCATASLQQDDRPVSASNVITHFQRKS